MLQLQRPIILDGAMGTELERRGIVLNNTRLWSSQLLIDDPAVVSLGSAGISARVQ
jgi:S-methylmethionine-dependent homocysteine/selenocysteine methylase